MAVTRVAATRGPTTSQAINNAGLELIFQHGYEAMSLRDLSKMVGIQPSSLYNHIQSKQALLFNLMHTHQNAVLEACRKSLQDIVGPRARLRGFAEFHVNYHIERKREVYVGNSELRSLEPANYQVIAKGRRAYELILTGILEEGRDTGEFRQIDMHIASRALLAMLTGVCTWFSPDGPLTAESITQQYAEMCVSAVAAAPPP